MIETVSRWTVFLYVVMFTAAVGIPTISIGTSYGTRKIEVPTGLCKTNPMAVGCHCTNTTDPNCVNGIYIASVASVSSTTTTSTGGSSSGSSSGSATPSTIFTIRPDSPAAVEPVSAGSPSADPVVSAQNTPLVQ